MRIGFTGSHSTGKTSVAQVLAEQHRMIFVPSTARRVAAAGLGVNRQANHVSQLLTTLGRVVDEQVAAENPLGLDTVSDRTPLDSLAYTKYQMDRVWDHDPINDLYWDYSSKFVAEAMTKYDLVFYFPIGGFALVEDGLRETEEKYRTDIDGIILELLKTYGIETYTVPNGTVQDRANYVYRQMEQYR